MSGPNATSPTGGWQGLLAKWDATNQQLQRIAAALLGNNFAPSQGAITPVKVAAYNIAATDFTVLANATSGAFPVNLLSAATAGKGKIFYVKKVAQDVSGNHVTVTAAGADLIDGAATLVLSTSGQAAGIISDGTSQWYVIARA